MYNPPIEYGQVLYIREDNHTIRVNAIDTSNQQQGYITVYSSDQHSVFDVHIDQINLIHQPLAKLR